MNLQAKSVARDLDGQWSQVQDMLRAEFGKTAYSTWLAPLTLGASRASASAHRTHALPARLGRAHYADRIRVLWRRVNPKVHGVALNVTPLSATPLPARRRQPGCRGYGT